MNPTLFYVIMIVIALVIAAASSIASARTIVRDVKEGRL